MGVWTPNSRGFAHVVHLKLVTLLGLDSAVRRNIGILNNELCDPGIVEVSSDKSRRKNGGSESNK